jgi:hypothetical protein
MTTRRFLLLVIIAALLLPHTFEISNQYIPDASFTRYSVITLLLTLFYEYGSTFVGPYSTLFIMPPTSTTLLNAMTVIVNISIILSLWGLMRGRLARRGTLYIIAIALFVHVFLLMGFFSIMVTGVTSVLAIPLPIFPIISILAILRNKIPISSS